MDTNLATPPIVHRFRPWWVALAIPIVFMAITTGIVAWISPIALLYTLPVFGIVLVLLVTGIEGLILTEEGIAWYALHPRWVFRRVPWSGVIKARRGFIGFGTFSVGPIMLTVEFRRYELWVWGKPRPDKRATIEIWQRWLVPCQPLRLWDAIEYWRNQPAQEPDTTATDAHPVAPIP